MQPVSEYSLEKLPSSYPRAEYRCRLVRNGTPLPVVVNGNDVGFQFKCGNLTVLATDLDYFDGVEHFIYLLNSEDRPIDQVSVSDTFGFLQGATPISETELSFGAFGTNDRWNLAVAKSGYWSYSCSEIRARFNSFIFAKRYLTVHRKKGPLWSMPT